MQEVEFLELHTDLFHAGKNFGKKLQPEKWGKQGSLIWDEEKKWFEVTWDNNKDGPRTGYIFSNNAAFWEPKVKGKTIKVPLNEHSTSSVERFKTAQVSTPMGHVHEGQGKGKTGKSK